ncbi:MAG: zinc ribbon domain-containing protein [Roseiflexaceae bacterium]
MVERICPACRYGNTVKSHYCNKCGAPLEQLVPANQESHALMRIGRNLPVNWRQLGTTVALGAAALAAEAGLAWLRRRAEAPAALARRPASANPQLPTQATEPPADARSGTTIISERIIEVRDSGDGQRTITDRHTWRKIDH